MKKFFKSVLTLSLVILFVFAFFSCDKTPSPDTVTPDFAGTSELTDTPEHVHAFSEWEVITEPSCEEEGLKKRICGCGFEESLSIDALGHNISETPETPKHKSCTVEYISVYKCLRDGCDHSKSKITPAPGHSLSDWVVNVEPTKTEDGEKVVKCLNCGMIVRRRLIYAGSQGLEYEIKDGEATVIGMGTCKDTELVIPEMYEENCPVTAIAPAAFYGQNIVSVTFSKNIKNIGAEAFYNCKKIHAVYIPSIVDWLEINFETQYSNPLIYASELYSNNKIVTEVDVPIEIKEINPYCFNNYKLLYSVTFNSELKSVGDYAFNGCEKMSSVKIYDLESWFEIDFGVRSNPMRNGTVVLNLWGEIVTDVVIPEGVTVLKNYALSSHTFKSVKIPSTIKEVEPFAFVDCEGVNKIDVSDIAAWCSAFRDDNSEYCVLYSYGNLWENSYFSQDVDLYVNGKIATNLVIPEGVEEISPRAFVGFRTIESVSLPKSLKKIGYHAFYGCRKIDKVDIKDLNAWWNVEIESDDSSPFYYSAAMTLNGSPVKKLTVPSSITEIPPYLFSHCNTLESVTIHKNVKKIGDYAFNTGSLEKVYISDLSAWCRIEFDGERANPLMCAEKLYLNNRLISDLVIPKDVTEISAHAFRGSVELETVTIHKGVKRVEEYAFFNGNIKELHIEDIAAWCAIDFETHSSNPLSYNEDISFYIGDKKVVDLVIPEKVERINSNAFAYYDGFESITIPASLKYIGKNAFYAYNTKNVYISDLSAWCQIEYEGVWNNPLSFGGNLYLNGELLSEIVIPSDVTKIGSDAFAGCLNITKVTIPNTVKEIGARAFRNCENLEVIILPEGLERIEEYTFQNCEKLTSIKIPDSVLFIGEAAFDSCKGLIEVELPDNLKIMESWVFTKCDSLKSIKIPEGVTEIPKLAFNSCDSLEAVELPSTILKIGDSAFGYCIALSKINIPKSVKFVHEDAFKNCKDIVTLTGGRLLGLGNYTSKDVFKVNKIIETIPERSFVTNETVTSVIIPSSLKTIESRAFINCQYLFEIVFEGTLEEWEGIDKEEGWFEFSNYPRQDAPRLLVIKCTDGKILLYPKKSN